MITKEAILDAQLAWGNGLVQIGADFQNGSDYKARAETLLDELYAYEHGEVLFKPTRAAAAPFRLTRDSALSYFIGGNPDFSEDKGFALEPWQKVEFENASIRPGESVGLAMGTYYFTNMKGDRAGVEYSFGYMQDDKGALRIVLHHSSMPFSS